MLSRPTRQRQTISKRGWWQRAEGYGFITRSGGSDVFEHISGLERSGLTRLSEGDRVLFDVADGRKGPDAAKVRLV